MAGEGFKIADAYVSVHAEADKASAEKAGRDVANSANDGIGGERSHFQDTMRKVIAMDNADSEGRKVGEKVGKGVSDGVDKEVRNRKFSIPGFDTGNITRNIKSVGTELGNAGSKATAFGRTLTIIGAINVFGALITGASGFVASLLPALGILAAIPGLAASAAAAVSALAIGLSGIGAAFKAFGKTAGGGGGGGGGAAKDTTSLQRAVESAARGITQAERDVAKAYRDVAEAEYQVGIANRDLQDSIHGVGEAEQGVQQAQKDTLDAQNALTQARIDATQRLADYQDQVEGAHISEERAAIALTEAQTTLQNLTDWGIQGTIQYQKAQLDVEDAQLRLKNAQEQSTAVQKQATDAQAKGVEGDQQVVDAKDNVTQAMQKQDDASYSLKQAQDGVADAAHSVAQAQQGLADANQGVLDAQEKLILAHQQLTDAQDALNKKMDAGGAAAAGFSNALAKLSPNARAFVEAVIGLKGQWDSLKNAVQDRLFEGLAAEVVQVANVTFPTLRTGLVSVAGAWNSMALAAGEAIKNPMFQGALSTIFSSTAASIQAMSNATGPLILGLANLAAVSAPFLQQFSEWIAKGLTAAGLWLQSAEGTERMRSIMARAVEVLKAAWDIALNLGQAFANMFKAFDSKTFLDSVVKITDEFAKWTGSVAGQEALKQFFSFLGEMALHVAMVMPVIGQVIMDIINILDSHPALKNFVLTLAAWLIVLGPVLGLLGTFISVVSVLVSIIGVLSAIAVAVGLPLMAVIAIAAGIVVVIVALAVLIVMNFDTIKNAIGSAWDWVSQKTSSVWSAITGAVGAAVGGVKGAINTMSEIPGRVGGFFEQVKNAVSQKFNEAVSFVRGIPGQIVGALGNVGSMLFNSGKSIIQGLIDGIKNMAGNVKNAISGVLADARRVLPFSPAKEGPFSGSGWTTFSGASMVDGLAQGIQTRGANLKSTMSDVLGGAASAIGGIGSGGGGSLSLAGAGGSTGSSIQIGNLTLQVNGSLDMTSETEKRKFIKQIRDGLVGIEAETR
jgi:phage-related protein